MAEGRRKVKRTLQYAQSLGTTKCVLSEGPHLELPVIPGILKHPRIEDLPDLLTRPDVAQKYIRLALSQCAWPVLRQFPKPVLQAYLPSTKMRKGRRRALQFLLGEPKKSEDTQKGINSPGADHRSCRA